MLIMAMMHVLTVRHKVKNFVITNQYAHWKHTSPEHTHTVHVRLCHQNVVAIRRHELTIWK